MNLIETYLIVELQCRQLRWFLLDKYTCLQTRSRFHIFKWNVYAHTYKCNVMYLCIGEVLFGATEVGGQLLNDYLEECLSVWSWRICGTLNFACYAFDSLHFLLLLWQIDWQFNNRDFCFGFYHHLLLKFRLHFIFISELVYHNLTV